MKKQVVIDKVEEGEKEEKVLKELEEKAGVNKIVVLHVIERSSIGYYNYKSMSLLVWYKENESVKYEDSDVRDMLVDKVYCGAYQEYSCELLLETAERRGWNIVKFPV